MLFVIYTTDCIVSTILKHVRHIKRIMKSDQTGLVLPIAELRGVAKRYGDVVAVTNLDLTIGRGEFLSFLGPSGCGKTTALRMLAGFETPDTGEVMIEGQRVNDLPPYRRPVNMVFQQYALFPHLTVAENISFGLRQERPRQAAAQIARAVDQTLDTVRMPGFGPRRIWELSGGQQQRVALARAIINKPKLLLLDEPMAALDRKLRRDMQIELLTLQRQLGITFVLVTHDQEEALSMSDRICIMRGGQIVQVGSPRDLYDRPNDRYVADFVGKSNFFAGQIMTGDAEICSLQVAGGLVITGQASRSVRVGQAAVASIRPEQIGLTHKPLSDTGISLPVTIRTRIFLGEHTEYLVDHAALGAFLVLVSRQSEGTEGGFDPGEAAHATWAVGAALILDDD